MQEVEEAILPPLGGSQTTVPHEAMTDRQMQGSMPGVAQSVELAAPAATKLEAATSSPAAPPLQPNASEADEAGFASSGANPGDSQARGGGAPRAVPAESPAEEAPGRPRSKEESTPRQDPARLEDRGPRTHHGRTVDTDGVETADGGSLSADRFGSLRDGKVETAVQAADPQQAGPLLHQSRTLLNPVLNLPHLPSPRGAGGWVTSADRSMQVVPEIERNQFASCKHEGYTSFSCASKLFLRVCGGSAEDCFGFCSDFGLPNGLPK